MDNDGMPQPPTKGRVYATLPTEVYLPIRLHINADWLLNISRTGLREFERNSWQREIADGITDILAFFLDWVACTLSEHDAAKAAFKVLAPPSSDSSGLEAILAEDRWLSMLRNRIEHAAVIPVWAEATGRLTFAKPGDTIVPPKPLATAFRQQPMLRPAILLKGAVLMENVLGPDAFKLLRKIGLLTEMSPRDLERVWQNGLEDWWETLADEPENQQRLLFFIWAAVAEVCDNETWSNAELPCLRSVTGKWISVNEATFLNEELPTEREPGGLETSWFMQPFILDENRLKAEWVTALRRLNLKNPERTLLSKAWNWLEDHARSISLKEIIKDATNALMQLSSPDWSALVPLGHWAKHRRRADLLTHVFVESSDGPLGMLVDEALLADPYVEHGQGRRYLFPTIPVISSVYLEEDPEGGSAYEWRVFFEEAGAKGALKVVTIKSHAKQLEYMVVAEFLEREIGPSNKSNYKGYTLLDFDIELEPPDPDVPKELRKAFAAWFDDGFGVLKGNGRRKCEYFYHTRRTLSGNAPSAWMSKLSESAWIPCNDGEFRRPQEVLPQVDLAREDAPYAQLSSNLLSILEEEGIKFGSAIPEATSLQRLLTVGSQLSAEELAQLLSECREKVISDSDRLLFDQVLQNLTVPSNNDQRVPLSRIVKRVGGRFRGALGGWIIPLNLIDDALRKELEHPNFPRKFPEMTTGEQSLDYILNIWRRALSSPGGMANEVRDILPSAYAYCLEDCAENVSLSERWNEAISEAVVFAERDWVSLEHAENIYFDDVEDRRFIPSHFQIRTVTGGHLGHTRDEQLRTSVAIGLPLLSSSITMKWLIGDQTATVSDDWGSRFDLICVLLRKVREGNSVESDRTENEAETRPDIIHTSELTVEVYTGNGTTECVPVNAHLHEDILTVSGRPVEFGSDAAKEFLREFSFGQRANLAADLTGMLVAIDVEQDFCLAVDKFRRSHIPDFQLPEIFLPDRESDEAANSGDRSAKKRDHNEPITGEGAREDLSADRTSSYHTSGSTESDLPGDAMADGAQTSKSKIPENRESDSMGGSYTRERALAQQNSLAEQLRNSLKGEIVPSPEKDGISELGTTSRDSRVGLGDEEYRDVAVRYERDAGREPEVGNPHQIGWDIRSTDPETGEVRLIEVKGKGRPWDQDEVVELSRAQIRNAFEAKDEKIPESWYLYVVEITDKGDYQVLPVANPVSLASKWILSGKSWRMVAETPKCIT